MKNIRILPNITARYPRISLWNTNPQPNQRLVVVNKEDFDPMTFLQQLGVHQHLQSSCLITNRNEIKRRQELFDWLMRNPAVAETIANLAQKSELPTEHKDFLRYYHSDNDHCPHWQRVHNFIEVVDLSNGPVPEQIKKLRDALDSHLELEETEMEVSKYVREFVEQISRVEGVLNIGVRSMRSGDDPYTSMRRMWDKDDEETEISDNVVGVTCALITERNRDFFDIEEDDLEENIVYGYSMFSQNILDAGNHEPRPWSKKWWAKYSGLQKVENRRVDLVNALEEFRAMNSRTISGVSDSIADDVSNALANWINELKVKAEHEDTLHNMVVKVKFSYDSDGLRIRILSMGKDDRYTNDVRFQHSDYKGLNPRTQARLSKVRRQLKAEVRRTAADMNRASIMHALQDNYSDNPEFYIFSGDIPVASAKMDRDFAYFAIPNSYRTRPIKSSIKALETHRVYVDAHFTTLKQVVYTLKNLQKRAAHLKAPMNIPDVLGNGKNVTQFETLYPVQLLWSQNRPKEIKAIAELPKLNGTMVGISGANAAGKTVTLKAYLGLIYMAQSGFPVFGTGVTLNVKNVIGGVFVTKDEDSLAQQWLIKANDLLDEAAAVERDKVMVVIDEIGSGTNPVEGMEVGAELLEALQALKYSTLWSCQNPRLFEKARDEMGCRVVQINRDHVFTDGIGTADFRGLADKVGFSKHLRRAS